MSWTSGYQNIQIETSEGRLMPQQHITPGLYLIATPIGNLGDVTFRAIEILRGLDVLYCEDSRITKRLLEAYDIRLPLARYDDHAGDKDREEIARKIADGQAVGLCSDAGTPVIADPGFKLIRHLRARNLPVTGVPGPNAAIHALALSGLPSDAFLFAGFPPNKQGARRNFLMGYRELRATLIFYEAPHRLVESLQDMGEALPGRMMAVARELTKTFEECRLGRADELVTYYQNHPPRGECVVLLGPPDQASLRWDEERLALAIAEDGGQSKPRALARLLSGPSGWASTEIYNFMMANKGPNQRG